MTVLCCHWQQINGQQLNVSESLTTIQCIVLNNDPRLLSEAANSIVTI